MRRSMAAAPLAYVKLGFCCILYVAAATVADAADSESPDVDDYEESTYHPPPRLAHPANSVSHISGSQKASTGVLWQDDFVGAAIDPASWTAALGNGVGGWGNNEQEFYTAEAATVSGGYLTLAASLSASRQYQSAKISTVGKHVWAPTAYFPTIRIEASIQLPAGGQGLWPAFWLLPEANDYGAWPVSGEIDIMEAINTMNTIYGTIHYGVTSPGLELQGTTATTPGFHTYGVDWSTTDMTFTVAGVAYKTVSCACAGQATGNCGSTNGWYSTFAGAGPCAPFNKPFYIIFNLAIGGKWPGDATAATPFPQTMKVDWVRVSSVA